jgi:hypothetical protein
MNDSSETGLPRSRRKLAYSKPMLLDLTKKVNVAYGICHVGNSPAGGTCKTGSGASPCGIGTIASGGRCGVGLRVS